MMEDPCDVPGCIPGDPFSSLCPRHLAEVPVLTEAEVTETIKSIEMILNHPVYGGCIPGGGQRYLRP